MRRRWQTLRQLTSRQWRVVAASAWLVPAIRLALAVWGFGQSADVLAKYSTGVARRAAPDELQAVAYAVGLVAGRRVVGAQCLCRSMALWFLLRRRGVDAELVVGALPAGSGPLQAHAWVEVEGQPVGDAPDVRQQFGSFGLSLPRLRAESASATADQPETSA